MPEYYTRKPNIKCFVCGKEIYRRPSQIKESDGRAYCGNICYGLNCRKEIPCTICGKLILSGLNKKTCSRKCSNKQRAGITYSKKRPRDKVIQYRTLKNDLLEERGKKCERCGYDNYLILQVHHKNRNRKDNRFSNLELICPNCHYEEHLSKTMMN